MKTVHYKRKPEIPRFDLTESVLTLKTRQTDEYLDIIAGNTTARIHKKHWRIEYFYRGKLLTYTGLKCLGIMAVDENEKYICEYLNLSVGEKIYGLGERFTNFVKNGQKIDIWNKDGGTGTEQSYINIPFYISTNSYGLLVNNPGKVSFEIGSEKVSKIQFSVQGNELEYLIFPGDNVKQIISRYTELAGKPPPAARMEFWLVAYHIVHN